MVSSRSGEMYYTFVWCHLDLGVGCRANRRRSRCPARPEMTKAPADARAFVESRFRLRQQ